MEKKSKHKTDTANPTKKKVAVEVVESVESELFKSVRAILAKARATVYTAANTAMVEAYWNVGREIVEKQGGASRAKYGDGLVKSLAVRLTAEFGEGFTVPNLRNMRQFYLTFPKRYALRSELNWTHYRILMRVENDDARDYYFNECVEAKWSTRILQRQIDTQFYERLVRNHSPNAARGLIKRGAPDPRDLVRSPAILEFAGICHDRFIIVDGKEVVWKMRRRNALCVSEGRFGESRTRRAHKRPRMPDASLSQPRRWAAKSSPVFSPQSARRHRNAANTAKAISR